MGKYRLNFGYKSEFSHEILSSIKAIKDKAFPYPPNEKSRGELPKYKNTETKTHFLYMYCIIWGSIKTPPIIVQYSIID